MRSTLYRNEGTLEEWKKVYSSTNLLETYQLFELKKKLVGYDPARAKHRRKDGDDEVLSQIVVGWDGKLWRFDEAKHKWITLL